MKQTTVFCVVSSVCVVILISLASASNLPAEYTAPTRHFQIEQHCAMIGGLCAHKSDCDEPASTKGLCPMNQALGAECCYRLKPSNRCYENAGECMPWCNERLIVPQTECESQGQMCCVLV